MASYDDVQQAIYTAVVAGIEDGYTSPSQLKDFAEAVAWVRQPGQSHGGGASAS